MEKINLAVLLGDNPGREMTYYATQILEYVLKTCQLKSVMENLVSLRLKVRDLHYREKQSNCVGHPMQL